MDDVMTKDEVYRALAGEEAALTKLVDVLTPVVQARVARVLLHRRGFAAPGRDVRQEVEDLVQEIFLLLFDDGGKVLRGWEPQRGLSLMNFAGQVAERRTISILRSGRRSPWKEDPTLTEELDREDPRGDSERKAASREELRLLVRRLTEELSPLGWHLFDLLFLRDLPVDEVVRRTGRSSEAVYQWKSRLSRLARKILRELSESGGPQRRPYVDG